MIESPQRQADAGQTRDAAGAPLNACAPPAVRRRAERPDDAPFRVRLFRDTNGALLAGLDPAIVDMLIGQQIAGQEMTYRARYPAARCEVIESGGAPVGRIVVDSAADAVTIVDLAVEPAQQRRGIGSAVLGEILAEAAARARPVRLSVHADNHGARRLYQRLGFTMVAATAMDVAMEWNGPAESMTA